MRLLLACLLIALTSTVFAQSKPPSPRSGKHVQQHGASAGAAASQSTPEQRGTPSAPLFVQSLPAADSASDAAHKEYEQHEKPALDRRLTVATELLAVFTFCLFVFTAALWWVTYRLSKEARNSAARQAGEMERSLAIAKLSADASVKSALAAEVMAGSIEKTAMRQLRAYVWKETASYFLEENAVVECALRNSGQTPAMRVRCWLRLELLDPASPEFEPPPERIDDAGFVINPGSTHTLHAHRLKALDEGDASDLSVGARRFYLWGEIRYDDIFGHEHRTRFRLFHRVYERGGKPMQIWSYCDEGNDAD